jgi:hypothetical protein
VNYVEQNIISVAGDFPEHDSAEIEIFDVVNLVLHRLGIVVGDEVTAVL